jgi:hypothetical protein
MALDKMWMQMSAEWTVQRALEDRSGSQPLQGGLECASGRLYQIHTSNKLPAPPLIKALEREDRLEQKRRTSAATWTTPADPSLNKNPRPLKQSNVKGCHATRGANQRP